MPVGSMFAGQLVVPETPESYSEFYLIECRIGPLYCGSPYDNYVYRGLDVYGFRFYGWQWGYSRIDFSAMQAFFMNDDISYGGDSVYPSYLYWSNYIDFSISNLTIANTNAPGCGPSGGVPPKCGPLPAVPLPASLPLFGAALLGAGLLRWFRGPRGTAPHPI